MWVELRRARRSTAVGAAPDVPIVLIHGFTGSAASWDPVVQRLPAHIPVYGVVLPGHAPSSVAVPNTFESTVARVADGIPAPVREGAHLCGYSMGGRIAIALALWEAAPWRRVTLISASPGLADAQERAARREADRRWCDLLRSGGVETFVQAWERLPIFAADRRCAPESALEAERSVRCSHSAEGLARSLQGAGLGMMPSMWERLAEVRPSVSLLVGEHDGKFVALAEAMASQLPGSWHEVVAGAGHNPLLCNPQAVADHLRSWGRMEPSAGSGATGAPFT